mmetsp:Transcript_98903/g.308191  ORF Transcript_98903/g.308191 Transcript_98903/m.308191 type:complete len:363 (-) Transcript_98903:129-1217(-)
MSPTPMVPLSQGHAPTDSHGALLLGLIYGFVHVIGPDHLGTLMTLSSVTSPTKAFRVGAAWGLGHSVGMVLVAAIFLLAHRLIAIDMDSWEHYGNYFIGASMMACALYFIAYESTFLKTQADGSVVPQACACHGPQRPADATPAAEEDLELKGTPPPPPPPDVPSPPPSPGAYGTTDRGRRPGRFAARGFQRGKDAEGCCLPCKDGTGACATKQAACAQEAPAREEALERQPLLTAEEATDPRQQSWWRRAWAERDAKGALLGVFQGLCCPLGMLGVSFLANLPGTGIAAFLVIFMFISAFGTASLAVAWATITAYGLGTRVSPQIVYRASCGFTLVLGLVWIVANHYGSLDKIDYAESLEG